MTHRVPNRFIYALMFYKKELRVSEVLPVRGLASEVSSHMTGDVAYSKLG